MQIKICGLRREEDIVFANALHPDWVGFVFARSSKRAVSPERAARLKNILDPGIRAVGVFVDEPPENVLALLEAGTIDAAQLHGHETNDDIRALRAGTKKPLIQAFHVASAADVRAAEASLADLVLLDNSSGGTGESFDWSLLVGVSRSFFLAGGLSPENVAAAIRYCRPFGVDASSLLETDGQKDFAKMRRFVQAARSVF